MKSLLYRFGLLVLACIIVFGYSLSTRALSSEITQDESSVRETKSFELSSLFSWSWFHAWQHRCRGSQCTIMQEIEKTHQFLLKNKNGLPYTPDPRDLQPFTEVVRLNIDSQALGYLNLFKLTGKKIYRQEAESRLDYIIQLGGQALRNSSFDGMIGYSFLYGYELTHNSAYYTYGMMLADRCLTYENKDMNWGYMCAMNLGKAHTLTGDQKYLYSWNGARGITRNTSNKQFADGSFPHLSSTKYGKNAAYTAWLLTEMLLYRDEDPENPDLEHAILNGADFLARRVNPDGTLNYEDEFGTYYDDPANPTPNYDFTSDYPGFAYVLSATGKNSEAQRLLTYLFEHQLSGKNSGSYPDKWKNIDPDNIWTVGNPSVLRTSVIFWNLTMFPLLGTSCQNGDRVSCVITPANCNSAFKQLGACDDGLTGSDVCIDGRFTKCINEKLVKFQPAYCTGIPLNCTYSAEDDVSEMRVCTYNGTRTCVNNICSTYCLNGNSDPNIFCDRGYAWGDMCSLPYSVGGILNMSVATS